MRTRKRIDSTTTPTTGAEYHNRARKIYQEIQQGHLTAKQIAEKYHVHHSQVHRIARKGEQGHYEGKS